MVHADDLDDGLVYEVNDAQDDDVVSDGEPVELDKDNDNNTAGEVSENKRALNTEDNGNTSSTEESEKPLSKRQKKLANSSLHQKKLERMAYEKAQKENLPKASVDKIIEYLATSIRDKNPDLSALELDELYFKKQDFLSTEKYEKDRTLNNFQDFIHTFSKSPRSIILSQSNIRVADVYRSVNGHQTAVKLFSKNKLKDDITKVEELLGSKKESKPEKKNKKSNKKMKGKNVSSETVKYFISTPTRIQKIIESTDLFFQGKEKLDIFIDASYLDPKNNTIFTSDDSAVLYKVLKEFLKNKSSVKILLF
ncbi:Cms1 [Kluyveromyces lactis]|nr:Cms1 [Kluyveromyces lactis]